jgi:hypothetical protein
VGGAVIKGPWRADGQASADWAAAWTVTTCLGGFGQRPYCLTVTFAGAASSSLALFDGGTAIPSSQFVLKEEKKVNIEIIFPFSQNEN